MCQAKKMSQPSTLTALPVLEEMDEGESFKLDNQVVYDYTVTVMKRPWVVKLGDRVSFTCPVCGNPMEVNVTQKRVGCKDASHATLFHLDLHCYQQMLKKGFLNMDKIPEGFEALLQGRKVVAAHPFPADAPVQDKFAIPICNICKGCRLFMGNNPAWKSSYGTVSFRCGAIGLHHDQSGQPCRKLNQSLADFLQTRNHEAAEDMYKGPTEMDGQNEIRNKWGLCLKPFNMPRYIMSTATSTANATQSTSEPMETVTGLQTL